jgi:N-methylhydantoinase A
MKKELRIEDVRFDYWLEARYHGQTHTVRNAYERDWSTGQFLKSFEQTYLRRFGHNNPNCEVEVLGLRLGVEATVPRPDITQLGASPVATSTPRPSGSRQVWFPLPSGLVDTPQWRREQLPAGFELTGPAVIEEFSSTTILLPGDRAHVGNLGEIVIDCSQEA